LKQIAAERIWKEFKKLLGAPEPYKAVQDMSQTGVLSIIFPDCVSIDGLHDLQISEQLIKYKPDPLLRLMALLPRQAEIPENLSKKLRLSNTETERLIGWVKSDMPDLDGLKAATLRVSLYRFGQGTMMDRFMLSGRDVRDVMAASRIWQRPDFPLGGEDLLSAGLKPGPAMGDMLRELEDWWIEGDFAASKADLLEELERCLKAD